MSSWQRPLRKDGCQREGSIAKMWFKRLERRLHPRDTMTCLENSSRMAKARIEWTGDVPPEAAEAKEEWLYPAGCPFTMVAQIEKEQW